METINRSAYPDSARSDRRQAAKHHTSFAVSSRRPSLNNGDVKQLSGLLKKTWYTYHASPLYNFKGEVSNWNTYARSLALYVNTEIKKGILDQEDLQGTIKAASFTSIDCLQSGEGHLPSVKVTLETSVKPTIQGQGRRQRKRKRDAAEMKVVLEAVLCSGMEPARMKGESEEVRDMFSYFPVILLHGAVRLREIFTTWLESCFDCHVSPLHLSPSKLEWVLTLWSTDVSVKEVLLRYKVPDTVDGLDTVTMKIDSRHFKNIATRMLDSDAANDSVDNDDMREVTEEQVQNFVKCVERNFFHYFRIHLEQFKLDSVGTGIVSVSSNAKVKLLSVYHMNEVIRFLLQVVTT